MSVAEQKPLVLVIHDERRVLTNYKNFLESRNYKVKVHQAYCLDDAVNGVGVLAEDRNLPFAMFVGLTLGNPVAAKSAMWAKDAAFDMYDYLCIRKLWVPDIIYYGIIGKDSSLKDADEAYVRARERGGMRLTIENDLMMLKAYFPIIKNPIDLS